MLKKCILFGLFGLFAISALNAQKYFTREGKVSFFSDAKVEKIEALNKTATSVYDAETGKMEFAVLVKAFQFEKALMQEHFNENYMETDKFPKASFKGTVSDFKAVNLAKDGVYPVKVKGQLTMHGVTKEVETEGKFTVKGGAVSATSAFIVAVADYGIEIPALVRDNIAKTVKIDISVGYQELKKGS
ncbi:MAG: YceI family protein [Saprospiraceae bacterium]|nr:YceI family protein [Saprospiraceae bacterium]MDZ4703493.1 YceI family protein [Saprospiraceae bacterium]